MNQYDIVPPFTGRHDPILVPAYKFDCWDDLWKWWCPCGSGAKSPQNYVDASKSGDAHAEAKNAQEAR